MGERLENESRREPFGVPGNIRDLVGEAMDDGWMAKEPLSVWLGVPKTIVSGGPGLGKIIVA